jgi:hypothetical protein
MEKAREQRKIQSCSRYYGGDLNGYVLNTCSECGHDRNLIGIGDEKYIHILKKHCFVGFPSLKINRPSTVL